MAKVWHKIHGIWYLYDHIREGEKVVCKLVKGGHPDMRRTTNANTRLSNSAYSSYDSQDDLDEHVRRSYVAGSGIKRIQNIFAELDLHPSRRETENYLQNDLGITMRTRKPKAAVPIDTTKEDLAQAKNDLALSQIESATKDETIAKMKSAQMEDTKEILRIKQKLANYRDMGRPPTIEEMEELIID